MRWRDWPHGLWPAVASRVRSVEGCPPQASVRHLQAALVHVHEPPLRFRLLSSLASGLIRSGQSLQAVRLLAEEAPTVHDPDLRRLLEGQRLMASAEDLTSFAVTLQEYPFDISRPGNTPGERALIAAGAGLCSVRADRAQESATAARQVWSGNPGARYHRQKRFPSSDASVDR